MNDDSMVYTGWTGKDITMKVVPEYFVRVEQPRIVFYPYGPGGDAIELTADHIAALERVSWLVEDNERALVRQAAAMFRQLMHSCLGG